jgi:hypothetical protein
MRTDCVRESASAWDAAGRGGVLAGCCGVGSDVGCVVEKAVTGTRLAADAMAARRANSLRENLEFFMGGGYRIAAGASTPRKTQQNGGVEGMTLGGVRRAKGRVLLGFP